MKKYFIPASFLILPNLLLAQTNVQTERKNTEEVFKVADIPPKAAYNFNTYLSGNLQYPSAAIEANIQGKLYVSFVIEKDGTISTAKVIKGDTLGGGLPEEALRVINTMPKWEAGTINGQPVRCAVTTPINFRLKEADTVAYTEENVPPKAPYDWNHYLSQNVRYPFDAREKRIQGKIYISFVVGRDGTISDVAIAKGKEIGNGLPEEGIRVISSMPKWEPGRQKGVPVPCYFTVPINFRVQ
ncbi:hypothetical protein DBR32_10160 [Taibaiella sp. KBW10]|uniref:energy transducer TonB n=1 Tax=Taibaiella sp. KBW10 TaxID=2153357 RepID=UPI000F59EDE8|nr:energy transducer TonB [Taibaiella sp. KBW10]RQO31059.1 hypothetical protein DBR32_10160 [Taibaiella sp. KBW10]